MTDWLQPLWDLFTPDGANQKDMDNKQVSQPNYNSFGRYANTFKYKVMYPIAQGTKRVTITQDVPLSNTGLELPYKEVLKEQTKNTDPRVDSANGNYDGTLSNMDIQKTDGTSSTALLAIIGMFFVALIIISRFKK